MATSPITMSHSDDASSHTSKSLAVDIVGVTRPMHTKINKLVTSRLPLALPPRASDAGPYISGLLHFLPVYMTFEKLWLDILDTPPVETVMDHSVLMKDGKDERLAVPERVHTILKVLYIPQLFRSDRLRADIKSMTGWSDDILDRQIHVIKGAGQLSAFISHIKQTVHAKPHTLIAYSYNLFMALFAGGRFIRASFEKAGDEYWGIVPAPIKPTMQPCEPRSAATSPLESTYDLAQEQIAETSLHPHIPPSTPLQFWRFDTANDGEDLKQDYKERLLRLEDELSAEERDDIMQESIIILESIGLIVGQLDTIYSDEQEEQPSIQIPKRPSLASRFGQTQFAARLRDSFLIARERGVGKLFRSQSLDAGTTEKGEHSSESEDADHDNADHDDVATGVELCPGMPKSMRFAKSLPVPPRRHGRVAAARDGGLNGKLRVVSPRYPANVTMTRPLLAGIVGLFLLYVFVRVRGIMSWGYTTMVQ